MNSYYFAIAFCKNNFDKIWREFNDTRCELIEIETLKHKLTTNGDEFTPYILFYEIESNTNEPYNEINGKIFYNFFFKVSL